MATTDTNVSQVVVNKLTKAQYDAATKSATEFYAVTDVDDGSYSTTEQKTGATWIDGKPIYKKTYSMGALINGGGTLVQNISSLGFENVVELRGIAINPTSKNVRPLPLVSNGLSDMVRLDVTNNEIHVITTTGSSWSTAYNAYVTLWYTKSTD